MLWPPEPLCLRGSRGGGRFHTQFSGKECSPEGATGKTRKTVKSHRRGWTCHHDRVSQTCERPHVEVPPPQAHTGQGPTESHVARGESLSARAERSDGGGRPRPARARGGGAATRPAACAPRRTRRSSPAERGDARSLSPGWEALSADLASGGRRTRRTGP